MANYKRTFNKKAYNNLPLLAPKLSKIETIKILKQESKSAVALAELKGLAKTLPNPNILLNAVVLKEAQASSEIENVITTHDKLYQALAISSDKSDAATKEVLRYRKALLMGFNFVKEKEFLNSNAIVSIQSILEDNDAGIRKLPGTTLINDNSKEVIYIPPDNYQTIMELMKNLEDYINVDTDDVSPLVKLAIQHYQFESIHPFYDGNGRTGRIINVLYLILKGLLDDPILYLSGYIIQHKSDYYRLLNQVRSKNNWEEWILYILVAIEQTSKQTIEQIRQINELFEQTQKIVKEKAARIYSKDLIEQLFVHPYCRIEFLVQNLDLNRKTASNYLKALEEINILKAVEKGRETIYVNSALYDLFRK